MISNIKKYLINNYNFDHKGIAAFLVTIAKSLNKDMALFETALHTNDYCGIENASHKLIASFGHIGLHHIELIFGEINILAKSKNDIEPITKLYTQIKMETKDILSAINEVEISVKKQRIFLIDDHDVSLFISQHLLKNLGFDGDCVCMPSGFTALNYMKENINDLDKLPSIIILDVNMPVIDGWDFLNLFHELNTKYNIKVKIVIASSIDYSEKCDELIKLGIINGFYQKPLKIANMQEILS